MIFINVVPWLVELLMNRCIILNVSCLKIAELNWCDFSKRVGVYFPFHYFVVGRFI